MGDNATQAAENAARLRAIYLRKKDELGITQTALANAMKVNQSTIAGYMGGRLKLGVTATLQFAKLLEVDPTEINPDIQKKIYDINALQTTTLPVYARFSGAFRPHTSVEIKGNYYMSHQLAVVVDDNTLYPAINTGSHIIIDPTIPPKANDRVLVRLHNSPGYRLFRLKDQNSKSIIVTRFQPVDDLDLIVEEHFPKGPKRIPLTEVAEMVKVVGIQYAE